MSNRKSNGSPARGISTPPEQIGALVGYANDMRHVAANLAHRMITMGADPEIFALALVEVLRA